MKRLSLSLCLLAFVSTIFFNFEIAKAQEAELDPLVFEVPNGQSLRQAHLDAIVSETYKKFKKASTTVKKSLILEERANRENAYFQESENFEDFQCTVKNVNAKDLKYIILSLTCGRFNLENTDLDLFGTPDNAILKNTPLYLTAIDLDKGSRVLVSGEFFQGHEGGLHEKSLTDQGKMSAPDYVVNFTSIKPVK